MPFALWSRPYKAGVFIGVACAECGQPIAKGQRICATRLKQRPGARGVYEPRQFRHERCEREDQPMPKQAPFASNQAPLAEQPPSAEVLAEVARESEVWMTAHAAIQLSGIIEDMRRDALVLLAAGHKDIGEDQLDTANRLVDLVVRARTR